MLSVHQSAGESQSSACHANGATTEVHDHHHYLVGASIHESQRGYTLKRPIQRTIILLYVRKLSSRRSIHDPVRLQ